MLSAPLHSLLAAVFLLLTQPLLAQLPAPAELVGPGVVSTNDVFGSGYSADLQEVYFVKAHNKRELVELWASHVWGGRWQPAQRILWTLPGDIDPALSPDGQRLYFNRRANPAVPASLDIWYSKRNEDGAWASPEPVPGLANSDSAEVYASATHGYDLYFSSNRGGNPESMLHALLVAATRHHKGSQPISILPTESPIPSSVPMKATWCFTDRLRVPDPAVRC